MSNLPSKPKLTLLQIMVDHPELGGALADFSELIMRGKSPFTPIERELVFAYISGLNQCGYCLASHKVVLRHFGVPETLVDNILAEVADPALDEKMVPVLAFAKKLTQEPESVDLADAEARLARGWEEDAVTHLVYVCVLASLYNRLVSGMGIVADQSVAEMGGRLVFESGYAAVKNYFPSKG